MKITDRQIPKNYYNFHAVKVLLRRAIPAEYHCGYFYFFGSLDELVRVVLLDLSALILHSSEESVDIFGGSV